MKIPNKVKIGGLVFEVQESQDIANQSQVFGSTHFQQQKVFLEPSETQQKKEHTFFHEMLHILLWDSGITKRLERYDRDLEEDLVGSLDNRLYAFLKDNNLLK